MKKYYLHGEYEVIFNGKYDVVLVAIACDTEAEAYILMENRHDIYKNMEILHTPTKSVKNSYKKT